MAPLGPSGGDHRVGVAVSGGADSMALALLLRGWGRPAAYVVDHGLRPGSADEAGLTLRRLAALGIPARLLPANLRPGPGIAARARAARYALLAAACLADGCADLAIGHHQRDQAETLLLRRAGASGAAGLAAMAAVTCTDAVRLLRPLLGVPPGRLRATLAAAGVDWAEDPTNRDLATPRARWRAGILADPDEAAPLAEAARAHGADRTVAEREAAADLADAVSLYPGGVAHLRRPVGAAALSALVWTVSGAGHPPPSAGVRRLLAGMQSSPSHAATLHGARLVPAAGWGGGWLLGREASAMQGDVLPAMCWDGRFQAMPAAAATMQDGETLGPLGADAARFRRLSPLPAALLQTLPTLRRDGAIIAVPHLNHPDAAACRKAAILFRPARPAAPAAFVVG